MDGLRPIRSAAFIMAEGYGKPKPSDVKPKRSERTINARLQNAETKKVAPPNAVTKPPQLEAKATGDHTDNKAGVLYKVASEQIVTKPPHLEAQGTGDATANNIAGVPYMVPSHNDVLKLPQLEIGTNVAGMVKNTGAKPKLPKTKMVASARTYEAKAQVAPARTNEATAQVAPAQVESKKAGYIANPKAASSKPAQRPAERANSTERNSNKLPADKNLRGRPVQRKQIHTSRHSSLFNEGGSNKGDLPQPRFAGGRTRSASTKKRTPASSRDRVYPNARDRILLKNKRMVFEGLQKKLNDIQTEFLQKAESLKQIAPDTLIDEFRLVAIVENDQGKFIIKSDELVDMPQKLPSKSAYDFKEKMRETIKHYHKYLMSKMKFEHSLPQNEIDQQQIKGLEELFKYIDTLVNAHDAELEERTAHMQREIQDGIYMYQQLEKKLTDSEKLHAKDLEDMEKEYRLRSQMQIAARDNQLIEANQNLKELEKHNARLEISIIEAVECTLKGRSEKTQMVEKLQAQENRIQALATNLNEAQNVLSNVKHANAQKLQKLQSAVIDARKKFDFANAEKQSERRRNLEHQKEILALEEKVGKVEAEKTDLELKIGKMEQENSCLQEMYSELLVVEDQYRILNERAKLIEEENKSYENKLSEVKQIAEKQCLEIEKQKDELKKGDLKRRQLEAEMENAQKLLDIRSDMLSMLQTNESKQRSHLEAMTASVNKKNDEIKELQNELQAKGEKFRRIFERMSSKESELSNIQVMLEHSNEHLKMTECNMKDQMRRLGDRMSHLEEMLTSARQDEETAAVPDRTDNYMNQRRRKRQNEIRNKLNES